MESRKKLKDTSRFNASFDMFLDELFIRIYRGCSLFQKNRRKIEFLRLIQGSFPYTGTDGKAYQSTYEEILKDNFMISFYDYCEEKKISQEQRSVIRLELDGALISIKNEFVLSEELELDLITLHKKARRYFSVADLNINRFNYFSSFLQLTSAGIFSFFVHEFFYKLNMAGMSGITMLFYISLTPVFGVLKRTVGDISSQETISSCLSPTIPPNSPRPSAVKEFKSTGTQTKSSVRFSCSQNDKQLLTAPPEELKPGYRGSLRGTLTINP